MTARNRIGKHESQRTRLFFAGDAVEREGQRHERCHKAHIEKQIHPSKKERRRIAVNALGRSIKARSRRSDFVGYVAVEPRSKNTQHRGRPKSMDFDPGGDLLSVFLPVHLVFLTIIRQPLFIIFSADVHPQRDQHEKQQRCDDKAKIQNR